MSFVSKMLQDSLKTLIRRSHGVPFRLQLDSDYFLSTASWPHKADDDAQTAHKPEHVRPANLRSQPAHNRCEDNRGEILRGVKDSDGGTALLSGEPGGDDARLRVV